MRLFRPIILIAAIAIALTGRAAMANVSILNDGGDGKPAAILIHGAIHRGDFAAFETAAQKIEQVTPERINDVPFITVELDSPGGDVVEAVDIGRLIYQHFMMTLVRPSRECVSACVFILIAGAVHTPSDSAAIGLHRPLLVSYSHMTGSEARAKYNGLMAYLREYFITLGVTEAAYDIMMDTDSYGMRYFTPAEFDRFRLRGEDPAWEKLYGIKWSAERRGPVASRKAMGALPKIAEIDESYRGIVFMPGAYHPGGDYLAGLHVPAIHFSWQSLDEDRPAVGSSDEPDPIALLRDVMSIIAAHLRQVWFVLAVAGFEVFRNRRYFAQPG